MFSEKGKNFFVKSIQSSTLSESEIVSLLGTNKKFTFEKKKLFRS